MNFAIPVGTTFVRRDVVTKEQTVGYFVPGMPEVYGTLMLILHMETAAADAIQPYLPAGWVSVGIEANVTQLAATPVGATVTSRSRRTTAWISSARARIAAPPLRSRA
jgi:fluoroacetyl-CoA thioesterase